MKVLQVQAPDHFMTSTFDDRVARLHDVLSTVSVLRWDAKVMMPPRGAEARGRQIATLLVLAREMLLDPGMGDAADRVMQVAECEQDRCAAQAVLDARAHHKRVPPDLLRRQAENSVTASLTWAEARGKADFALFQPHLQCTIDLAREQADALGYENHPYEPIAQTFEPGATTTALTDFFDTLRSGLRSILDTVLGRPEPRTDFLFRDFPIEGQQAFCAEIARSLGYDFDRGRLDTSAHPFAVSFSPNDVRITSRWNLSYLPASILGTIHETGHALYEMGVNPALVRTAHATDMIKLYAVGGTSFGMHESQSRLLENHIGRSPEFWAEHYGQLRDVFPGQLSDVTEAEFVACLNRVSPGFVRIEADELTYDLHIMLRVRIEMALMDGSLAVADVPEAWNAAMSEDLGLTVPDDALGCLQDAHWSSGYIGSFPTYTIGNSTAAQIMAHLDQTRPTLREEVAKGDATALNETLGELVWQHGRTRTRAEILADIGEAEFDPSAYLAYLRAKFLAT